jgi:hypothetical protein
MASGYKINWKVTRLADRSFLVEYLFLTLCLVVIYRSTGHQTTTAEGGVEVTESKCLAHHRSGEFREFANYRTQ